MGSIIERLKAASTKEIEVIPGLWARIQRITALDVARHGYLPDFAALNPADLEAALSGLDNLTAEEKLEYGAALMQRMNQAEIRRALESKGGEKIAYICAGVVALRLGADGEWEAIKMVASGQSDAAKGVLCARDLPLNAVHRLAEAVWEFSANEEEVSAALNASFPSGA